MQNSKTAYNESKVVTLESKAGNNTREQVVIFNSALKMDGSYQTHLSARLPNTTAPTRRPNM